MVQKVSRMWQEAGAVQAAEVDFSTHSALAIGAWVWGLVAWDASCLEM